MFFKWNLTFSEFTFENILCLNIVKIKFVNQTSTWEGAHIQGFKKNDPLTNIDQYIHKPLLYCLPKQFLKFLTEQDESKFFCVRRKYKVTVKICCNKAKGKLLSQNAAQPVGNIMFKMSYRKIFCSFRSYNPLFSYL